MTLEYPKRIKKHLRDLVSKSYKRELDNELLELYKEFDNWKQGNIDCFELCDIIHKYHDGIFRVLYKQYGISASIVKA